MLFTFPFAHGSTFPGQLTFCELLAFFTSIGLDFRMNSSRIKFYVIHKII